MIIQAIFVLTFGLVFVALILGVLGSIGAVRFVDRKYLDRIFYGGICTLLAGVVGFLPYIYATQKFSAQSYSTFIKDVRSIQKVLAVKGYYKGELDGVIGNQMFKALQQFQKDSQLREPKGQIDKETIGRLFTPEMIGIKTLPDRGREVLIESFSWPAFSSRVSDFERTFNRAHCGDAKSGGIVGPDWTNSIICFQRMNKLRDDGELGIDTILNIVEFDLKFF